MLPITMIQFGKFMIKLNKYEIGLKYVRLEKVRNIDAKQ